MTIRLRIILILALLIAAVFITYSNHFNNGFHFDDSHTIANNLYIRDIGNIPLFFTDGSTSSSFPYNQSYRPVVTTSLALDYWMGKGLKPFYFHRTMFVLFVIQGILMFFLYLRIFGISAAQDANVLISLIAVAWYMLHPANAETMNYILARSDSISTLFVVLAFVLFMYSRFCRKWHIYLVPAALGVLTKPTAAMFAPPLLAYLLLFEQRLSLTELHRREARGKILAALRAAAPAFLVCALLFWFCQRMKPDTVIVSGASVFSYAITQPFVLLHYFGTLFLPLGLSADTDWQPLASMADWRFFAGMGFIGILLYTAIVLSARERMRPVSFGIIWFFISLVPTSSIIPLSEVMNDHRLFYPYVGLVMSVCWLLGLGILKVGTGVAAKRTYSLAVAMTVAAVLSVYAYGTNQRNRVWTDDETLWRDVTVKSPKNARGLMNYGLQLMMKADYAGAEGYFSRAMELNPNYAYLHINMGILKEATGRPAEAEGYFKRAIECGKIYNGCAECYFYYGRFLRNMKRIDQAVLNLGKAIEISSAHLDARHLLMGVYFEQREYARLAGLARTTLEFSPADSKALYYLDALKRVATGGSRPPDSAEKQKTPEYYLELSLKYYQTGKFRESIEAARRALKLRPNYDLAYNNICAAYNALKQWDRAIEAGETAVKLNPGNQLAKNNLALALAAGKIGKNQGADGAR